MQADSCEWRVCMEICQCSSVSSLQDGGRSSRGHTLCDMQASLVCSAFVCCSDVGGKQRPSLYVCQSISENQHGWIMRHITSLPTTSIFFLSLFLSKKKEIKQDSTNTRKKVWQWQQFSFFFYRDKQMALYTLELQMINSFHVTQNKIIGLDGC